MVITLVVDMFGNESNGTTITAMRAARVLKEHGNEVRIIAFIPKDHTPIVDTYAVLPCREIRIPLFQPLVSKNGMYLADIDVKEVADFIRGSDVVHVMLPFLMESRVRRVAKVMGIPVTSAMHCQPENVSYNLGMGKVKLLNSFIYRRFYRWCYRYTRCVHTPSEMMKEQMELHHYPNSIYSISNGVDPKFHPIPTEKPAELKDKYVVLMIGRLAGEKRQDLLIKAIGHSVYNSHIQLILCGQGPRYKKYKKMADKYLVNPCQFGFHPQDELLKIINYADLYVHTSDAESEAISCIEAFSCGKVPIISDSKVSATNHFALDKRCLFRAGDYRSLQKQIEYFIEHPEVKAALSEKYVAYGKTFALEACVAKLESMFRDEIASEAEDTHLQRTYFSDFHERRKLRAVAKKIGLENPVVFKASVNRKG